MQKKCKICKQYFVPNKYRPNQRVCGNTQCQKEAGKRYRRKYNRIWRKRHPDYYKEYMKKYNLL